MRKYITDTIFIQVYIYIKLSTGVRNRMENAYASMILN